MTAATPPALEGCANCQMLKYEVEIKLVDELGQPLPDLPYVLWVGHGPNKVVRQGQQADANGVILEKELPPGPLYVLLQADPLADVLQEPHRHLRASRVDEHSKAQAPGHYGTTTPVQQAATAQGRIYAYRRLGQVVDRLPTLFIKEQQKKPEDRQPLPPYHFPDGDPAERRGAAQPLCVLRPNGTHRYPITLEITPLRAWVLMLDHSPDYQLSNGYNLALMAVLAYADGSLNSAAAVALKQRREQFPTDYQPTAAQRAGSIRHFFVDQMQDLAHLPSLLNGVRSPALVKDVPYQERYENPVFIDVTTHGPNGETPPSNALGIDFDSQFFYVSRLGELLISWRGTEGKASDALTDLDFTPVPCAEMGIAEQGKAHKGFYRQFQVVTEHPSKNIFLVYKKIKDLLDDDKNTKLFIAGHSLGGALALLHAARLKAYDPLLYTYGMPRTLTERALRELNFTHYRHRNEQDLVTTVPPGRGLDTPVARVPVLGKASSVAALALPDLDPFGHYGKLIHFDNTHTLYRQRVNNQIGETKLPLPTQAKLLVAPHLAQEGKVAMHPKAKAALASVYPNGENPGIGGGERLSTHASAEYAGYLRERVVGLLARQQGLVDPRYQQVEAYSQVLNEQYIRMMDPVDYWPAHGALALESQLALLLPAGHNQPEKFAFSRLHDAIHRQGARQ